MKVAWTAALVFGVLSGPALGAEPWCEDFAAQLRNHSDIRTGQKSVAEALMETAALFRRDIGAEEAAFGDRTEINRTLREKYGLSAELHELETYRLDTAPGTNLHALIVETGTAHCQAVLAFRSGQPAEKLPEPPNPIASLCETDRANFGLVQETPAFVETFRRTNNHEETVWISRLEGSRWGLACKMKAQFEPVFTSEVAVATDSVISARRFTKAALETAIAFHAGAALPNLTSEAAMTPADVASWKATTGHGFEGLPLFTPRTRAFFPSELRPLSLDGRTFLLGIARGYFPRGQEASDIGVTLYDLSGGKGRAIAAAHIRVGRGALASLQTEQDTPKP